MSAPHDTQPNKRPSRGQHPNADVRMRGFAERTSVEKALAWLDMELDKQGLRPSESVSLDDAAGRVLAKEIVSAVNVPNFQRAMMDGYALHATDIANATTENPKLLTVLGDSFPGKAFNGKVGVGQAVRIMTGAPLPAGADSVVPVEQSKSLSATGVQAEVHISQSQPAGKNVGRIGEDIQRGDVVLAAGRLLRPQDIGVLSSIGYEKISVVRSPRVRILVTGDELLPAGVQPHGHQIADANGPMLTALVQRDGGRANHPGIVPDDRESILAALNEDVDLILTSGGSSVGQEDYVPTLLAEHGELAVHGVTMRPASPIGMGTLNGRLVILLPGNPVACLWGYDLFAARAIRRLGGRDCHWPYRKVTAKLSCDLASPIGRLDYVRVQLADGLVAPITKSGASVLSSTSRADGFIVIPAETESLVERSEIDVHLYDLDPHNPSPTPWK